MSMVDIPWLLWLAMCFLGGLGAATIIGAIFDR